MENYILGHLILEIFLGARREVDSAVTNVVKALKLLSDRSKAVRLPEGVVNCRCQTGPLSVSTTPSAPHTHTHLPKGAMCGVMLFFVQSRDSLRKEAWPLVSPVSLCCQIELLKVEIFLNLLTSCLKSLRLPEDTQPL